MIGFSKKLAPPSRQLRNGFSLMEVIMATAILMGSAVVLSRLAGMGREQSAKAQLHTEAQELCERTLNELLLGLRPMDVVEQSPLIPVVEPFDVADSENELTGPFRQTSTNDVDPGEDADPEWRHSIRMESLPSFPGLWSLTVIVVQGDQTLRRPIRFSLTRWIAGPPDVGAFDELSSDFNIQSDFESRGSR